MVALMGYDTIKKRKQWEEYANEGDVYAQYELAQSYCCRPHEGSTDIKKAFKWWCVAGKSGYALAQLQLGKIYDGSEILNELSVPQDISKAYMWYQLAKRRGNEEARNRFLNLKNSISSDVMAEGEKMLTNWKSVPCG
jgi:TPR repeat protein